jgi:hypothetical protein
MITSWTDYTHTLNKYLDYIFDKEDQLIWSFSYGGKYSPKLGYISQFQATNLDPPPWWENSLSRLKITTKSKLFDWILLQNKFPNWEYLQSRSFIGPRRCSLYKPE